MRPISRRRLLLRVMVPASGVMVGRQLAARSSKARADANTVDAPVYLDTEPTVPLDIFRENVSQGAANIGQPTLSAAIRNRVNCYWDVIPDIRSLPNQEKRGLVNEVVALFAEVPNVEQLGEIIRHCLDVGWSADSAAVAELTGVDPDMKALLPQMEDLWGEASEAMAVRYGFLKESNRLEHALLAQQTAGFAISASAVELAELLALGPTGQVRAQSHLRWIAEAAIFVAASQDLVAPTDVYESRLDEVLDGHFPLG